MTILFLALIKLDINSLTKSIIHSYIVRVFFMLYALSLILFHTFLSQTRKLN